MTDDMWGDLPSPKSVTTPHEILEKQALLLHDKTGGTISGSVTRVIDEDYIILHLQIRARELDAYSKSIVRVVYTISNTYPLNFHNQLESTELECKTEEEFIKSLRQVLQSKGTHDLLNNILVHIKKNMTGVF